MTDHWWWRPGVRPGRRLLVWHILLDDLPEVRDLVRQCQDKLADFDGLDLIPEPWLHMTTQIVGFPDQIPDAEVDSMVEGVRQRFVDLAPVEVEIGKLWFHSEAVMLGIRPAKGLDPVRTAIRTAVAETVRAHQLADEPAWTPHVSIAYSSGDGPAAPVIQALDVPVVPRPLRITAVDLVEQVRDGHLYRWDRRARAYLGQQSRARE
ncbi:2'-5' RNA ligase family protein [Actinomadura barringtoniae]|uniref:2'-5' RNA ligase family protein n=1 Tax=Actinomadura barringtoniae TaxID=1427535 RepID=A0A939PHJ0_9ACTN|nr:2'-5' RNA ligase family protein [Actinomadura barringtoniae]MBO2452570.1 2'-5' RNA ligase family protein [Actinomadura barringtoniae]